MNDGAAPGGTGARRGERRFCDLGALPALVYHERFGFQRGVGFALIWAALLLYAADGLWRSRRAPQLQRA